MCVIFAAWFSRGSETSETFAVAKYGVLAFRFAAAPKRPRAVSAEACGGASVSEGYPTTCCGASVRESCPAASKAALVVNYVVVERDVALLESTLHRAMPPARPPSTTTAVYGMSTPPLHPTRVFSPRLFAWGALCPTQDMILD